MNSFNRRDSQGWLTLEESMMNSAPAGRTRAASFDTLVRGRCTVEDALQEFRLNGYDTPYEPYDWASWRNTGDASPRNLMFRRQTSCPPDYAGPQPISRPTSASYTSLGSSQSVVGTDMLPLNHVPDNGENYDMSPVESLTEKQRAAAVLSSLPDETVWTLLKHFRPQDCRFCKKNGERASFYRTHVLKDAQGRVQCPVLRAFACKRCGATGDNAHTFKYCPLSSKADRRQSEAIMKSIRMASGRRRTLATSSCGMENFRAFAENPAGASISGMDDYRIFSENPANAATASGHSNIPAPLDPDWIALIQKLMLS